jgi:hypothetical protein
LAPSISQLQQLADDGCSALSYAELHDLAEWCWDYCVATGDARFCVFFRILHTVNQWQGEQGVPKRLLDDVVDPIFKRGLRNALEAPNPASGAQFAQAMAQEVSPELLAPSQWSEWL